MTYMKGLEVLPVNLSADSEGDIIKAEIKLSKSSLMMIGEIELVGQEIIAKSVSTHGEGGLWTNRIGSIGLRRIIQGVLALEEFRDVEAIVIEGSKRTTGANPGRTPKPVRFERTRRNLRF
ncbi:hypothetical protein [Shimia sp.]|uniref:hypothetical protein n=1 Tax=Shimia sp. TaxID=1954381 RepID=UPI003BA8ABE5